MIEVVGGDVTIPVVKKTRKKNTEPVVQTFSPPGFQWTNAIFSFLVGGLFEFPVVLSARGGDARADSSSVYQRWLPKTTENPDRSYPSRRSARGAHARTRLGSRGESIELGGRTYATVNFLESLVGGAVETTRVVGAGACCRRATNCRTPWWKTPPRKGFWYTSPTRPFGCRLWGNWRSENNRLDEEGFTCFFVLPAHAATF